MKKLILILFSTLIFAANSLTALLPPLYHTISGIKGLLDEIEKNHVLDSADGIVSITATDHGYIVKTYRNTMNVVTTVKKNDVIGPAVFNYHFEAPVPNAAK